MILCKIVYWYCCDIYFVRKFGEQIMIKFRLFRNALYTFQTEGLGSVIKKTYKHFIHGAIKSKKLDMVVIEITTFCNLKVRLCKNVMKK
jgi:hypothetical protein